MAFYFAVDYIRSESVLTLRIVDANESRGSLFEGEIPFESSGPNEVKEIGFRLPIKLTFREPGDYRAEVLVNGETIYARRFAVVEA
jgi:hypothetical protein